MADQVPKQFRLRDIDGLNDAHEYLFNRQAAGKMDGKMADGLNTTLKGSVYLNVKLKMEAFKLNIMAHKAKMEVPPLMLPEGMRPKA
ncbi:MAG: hypothetical protein U1C74_15945 [Phenylobacterium sp.]|nr:hypothetical protein [Candidatus Omnitrophota bacterium]MDZ4372901.1 hypothetical protein [Phenylobacterium sp.]